MDFRLADDVLAFQDEVRAFMGEEMGPRRTEGHSDPADLTNLDESFERALQGRAGQRGYLGLTVDPALGGGGKSIWHQVVFNFEAARADAPLIDTAMTLAGSAILAHGSAAQKQALIPRMIGGEIEMSIAYSEAMAGTELNALQATADRDGDDFVLRGSKVMVTGSHKSDYALTIARTTADVPARQGMTMFIVDLGAPGVRRTRRTMMNGWTLGEITFDGLRLDADAVLGEVDGGWRQLMSSLEAERSGVFHLGFVAHVLDLLVEHCRTHRRDGVLLADDPVTRERIAQLFIELEAGMRLAKRTTWLQETGQPNHVEASMAKVFTTELEQRVAQAATEIAGYPGQVYASLFAVAPACAAGGGRFAWEFLERTHATVSVGANETQRDTIAQAGLGLPRPGRP